MSINDRDEENEIMHMRRQKANYEHYEEVLLDAKNAGAFSWSGMLSHEKKRAAMYLLRSDVGSEVLQSCEGLAEMIALDIFDLDESSNGIFNEIMIEVGYRADKFFFGE